MRDKELSAVPKCFSCLGSCKDCRFGITSSRVSLKEAETRGTCPRLSLLEKLSPSVIAATSEQNTGLELSEVLSNLKFSMTKAVFLKKELFACQEHPCLNRDAPT